MKIIKRVVFEILREFQWHWVEWFPGRTFPIWKDKLKKLWEWSKE